MEDFGMRWVAALMVWCTLMEVGLVILLALKDDLVFLLMLPPALCLLFLWISTLLTGR